MSEHIKQNVKWILSELPPGVQLLAAAKGRLVEEVLQAIEAGVGIIGENYVQEAERAYQRIGPRVKWHLIGHLQKNKVKRAVEIFDMIETVDSVEVAREIDRRCAQIGKTMPVLIEVNSGHEAQKSGAFPEEVEPLVRQISTFSNMRVVGLMTMGPSNGQEDARPYFAVTRRVFEHIRQLALANVEIKYLSMGMSGSYGVAIEEGANIIRLGNKIFGESWK
jgi:pyridoxal phosphate enzyme (YggS family)